MKSLHPRRWPVRWRIAAVSAGLTLLILLAARPPDTDPVFRTYGWILHIRVTIWRTVFKLFGTALVLGISLLPLSDGNPFVLSRLVPGVAYTGDLKFSRPFDNGGTSSINADGSTGGNEFTLDGR